MQIVIPGALPPVPVAAELARRLPEHAPTLSSWFQAATAQPAGFDVHAQGCTPFEAWQLEQAGYRPSADMPVGAGLGPLLAGPSVNDADPVWLAELAHLSLGTDQAALLHPEHMEVRAEESQALFATARPSFEAAGFTATPLFAQRWRLTLPAGLRPVTASPAAVAGQPLRDWWRQDADTRPWRRLLNEIQMAWHQHPVNEAREARGVPPINGLWLYGGATAWRVAAPDPATHVYTELAGAHRDQDWGRWLDTVKALDQRLRDEIDERPARILLFGVDRRVTLALQPRSRLLAWLPAPKKNWNTWWSRPV